MKIAVLAPTPVPETYGGAERATAGLVEHLRAARGHDVEIVTAPVAERTLGEVVAGYRRFADLDLSGFDAAISCKYPAWIAPHPHHRVLMFHPLRGLYDTYHLFRRPHDLDTDEPTLLSLLRVLGGPAERARLDDLWERLATAEATLGTGHPAFEFPGPLARHLVRYLDRVALAPGAIERHLTLSATVAARPEYLPPGVAPLVAHLPSDLPLVPPHAARHFFTTSRHDGPKRLDLLVSAMRRSRVEVPLLIGGTGPDTERLREMADGDERIRFLGFVPDDHLAELYATSVAVPFVPLDEDYGLIAVEAMAAGTPVITCEDSGGPTELVAPGVSGWVVEPDPDALAAAMEDAVARPDRTTEMGRRARTRAGLITWDRAARRLLDGLEKPTSGRDGWRRTAAPDRTGAAPRVARHRPRGRARIVVATTFPLEPALGGGQIRARHLYSALTELAEVEVVCLDRGHARARRTELAPGFVETVVPRSVEHEESEFAASVDVGVPVGDVMIGPLIHLTPAYTAALAAAAEGAALVVLGEPYQLPSVDAAGIDLPLVYDAYNVELDLKQSVYPPTRTGRQLLDAVRAIEADALGRSRLVVACAPQDATRFRAERPDADLPIVVVPNGVDTARAGFHDAADRRRAGARWRAAFGGADPSRPAPRAMGVFFGSHHPPNIDAAEVLIDLAERRPDVVVVLAGGHADQFQGRRLPPNVAPVGIVSEHTKTVLLRAADVAFNPMRTGSGTNLKIIEYLSVGTPVLSTPFGARGLGLVDGEHLRIAEPARFAEALDGVLDDPDGAAARARAGRDLVVERYDWQTLGRGFTDAVAEVLHATRR